MRRVVLQGTDLNVSRLSFGTARLHHLLTSRLRQYLLAAAFDSGYTHFDTAPSYGFGIAEQELGRFLRTRPGDVTLATKIGLYPPSGAYPHAASVWARKAAGKMWPTLSRPISDWSVATASRSLDTSLRCLNREQIDLLLLHEPTAGAFTPDVLLEWLRQKQAQGKIRTWGLAGHADRMGLWLSGRNALGTVLQVQDSLDGTEGEPVRNHGRDFQITYGYLASRPIASGSLTAIETLKRALRRNATGSILLSSRQSGRLRELAAVAETGDGLDH